MGKHSKRRGKRGKHLGRAIPRSLAGRRHHAFKRATSHLQKGHWEWLQHPDNQDLLARWERYQLNEQDRDITLAGEPTSAHLPHTEGEDSPESSAASRDSL